MLPAEKTTDLVAPWLQKEKGCGRQWQSHSVPQNTPHWDKSMHCFGALENNDIGSIKGLELFKEPYQKYKLWLCVKQYPLLRVPLERIKSVMKKLEKPGII